jgi:hypothetical protein
VWPPRPGAMYQQMQASEKSDALNRSRKPSSDRSGGDPEKKQALATLSKQRALVASLNDALNASPALPKRRDSSLQCVSPFHNLTLPTNNNAVPTHPPRSTYSHASSARHQARPRRRSKKSTRTSGVCAKMRTDACKPSDATSVKSGIVS